MKTVYRSAFEHGKNLSHYLINILLTLPKLNIQKLCRERSDLDDVYVTALFEYCLFKNTGKRLEEVGCIIANGGNGGMRIFPQSDKDYEFLPKPEAEGGLNEKTLARVKEDMDALSSTFFTLRIGETPQEMMIHANAEFAKVLQELRMVESDGDAFRYSIRAIEAIAKQHGIILEITEQEKVGHFLSHLLDALEVSGLPIQPEQREQTLKNILQQLTDIGVTTLHDIPTGENPFLEAVYKTFHIEGSNRKLVINAYTRALQEAQKANIFETFLQSFVRAISTVGLEIHISQIKEICNAHGIQQIQQLPNTENPVESIIMNALEIPSSFQSTFKNMYETSLRATQKDSILNEKSTFSEFQKGYQSFTGAKDFETQKGRLIRALHDSILQTLMILRENMTTRFVSGDKNTAEQYFQEIQQILSSKREDCLTLSSEQTYPVRRFFPTTGVNVKEDLYRPIQTAFLNILTEQGKIHHGNLEDLISQLIQDGHFTKNSADIIIAGLKAIDYLRMRLAQYHALTPFKKTKEANTITQEFLEWAQTHIPSLGKILVDIQNALALIEPISRNQQEENRYGTFGSTLYRNGFYEEKGQLGFRGDIREVPEKRLFLFSALEHIGNTGLQPDEKMAVFLYHAAQEYTDEKNGDLSRFFFNTLLQQQYFSEAVFWFARLQLLQKIFPAYANIIETISPNTSYLAGDEMLASLFALQEHVAQDEEMQFIWSDIQRSGNMKILRLALLIRQSHKSPQATLREMDPRGELFSEEEIADIAFLVEHQRCLVPPGNKAGAHETQRNNEPNVIQFDLTVFGKQVNPILIEAFDRKLAPPEGRDSRHLMAPLFAINLARKIAINPRRNDLSEIKTSLIRFYKQYHFLRFIRNALEKHESFFWEIFSDAFLNETNIQPTDGELKQYFDALKQYPSVLYTRMIDALGRLPREERNSLLANSFSYLEKVIKYFDYASMQAEYETLQKSPNDSVAYTLLSENRKDRFKICFRVPRTAIALENIGIAFSNHHWSLEQASTLPLNGETTLITLEGKYTGHEHHASFQKALDEYIAISKEPAGRLLKKTNGKEECFSEEPNVIVNTEESSVEIISYEPFVPAYALANILHVFGKHGLTPLHFTLVTKIRKTQKNTVYGIHDKFYFEPGTSLPKEISDDLKQQLTTNISHE